MPHITKCPYTLQPLDQFETDREHVILDCLGGPDGYSVRASKAENSSLGNGIDAMFASQLPIIVARMTNDIKSRSGAASWEITGTTKDSQQPINVRLTSNDAEFKHAEPVKKVTDDGSYQITGYPKQVNALFEKMKKGHARKGRTLTNINRTELKRESVVGQINLNLNVLDAGLAKIAYLATFEHLGDAFLSDPLNPDWQKAIRATTKEAWLEVGLRVLPATDESGIPHPLLHLLWPDLKPYEHGIAILRAREGLLTGVRLFGQDVLTKLIVSSESDCYGLSESDGVIIVCNVKGGPVRKTPWDQHVLRHSFGIHSV